MQREVYPKQSAAKRVDVLPKTSQLVDCVRAGELGFVLHQATLEAAQLTPAIDRGGPKISPNGKRYGRPKGVKNSRERTGTGIAK